MEKDTYIMSTLLCGSFKTDYHTISIYLPYYVQKNSPQYVHFLVYKSNLVHLVSIIK